MFSSCVVSGAKQNHSIGPPYTGTSREERPGQVLNCNTLRILISTGATRSHLEQVYGATEAVQELIVPLGIWPYRHYGAKI